MRLLHLWPEADKQSLINRTAQIHREREEAEQQQQSYTGRAHAPKFRGANLEIQTTRQREWIVSGPRDTGKAQPLDSIVYTPAGPRLMGDLRLGDLILTPDGSAAEIDAIYPQGEQDVYRITFGEGDSVECTEDHLWIVGHTSRGKRPERIPFEKKRIVTLRALRSSFLRAGSNVRKYWIPLTEPVRFTPRPIRIDPYVMGVLLGDGHIRSGGVMIASGDSELIAEVQKRLGDSYLVKHLSGCDYRVNASGFKPKRPATAAPGWMRKRGNRWEARGRVPGSSWKHLGSFISENEANAAIEDHAPFAFSEDERRGVGIWSDLDFYGLQESRSATKFIPDDYLYNSPEIRLDVLRGLMDTDGTVDRRTGAISFSSISKVLSTHVKLLVDSLGGVAAIKPRQLFNGSVDYRVRISYPRPDELFLLERKRQRTQPRQMEPRRMIAAVEYVGRKECQCISVASEKHLYLTNHFAVTHNTFAALWRLDSLLRSTPGAKATLCRKIQATIYNTVLVTWENIQNLRQAMGDEKAEAFGGKYPQLYTYANGSRLWCGGMDNPQKILSGERDWIFTNQTEEFTLEDWELLIGSSTGRGAVTDTPMLFGDCNPGSEDHWILTRPTLKVWKAHHKDNPSIYHDDGTMTRSGEGRIRDLQSLTGIRKKRLYEGQWVGAEGLFFENFDPEIGGLHVCEPHDIPGDALIWGALDWGRVHPLAFGLFTENDDGIEMIWEHVQNKWLIPHHCRAIRRGLEMLDIGDWRLNEIVAGHDVFVKKGGSTEEDEKTLAQKFLESVDPETHEANGFDLTPANIARIPGWNEIEARLGNPDPAVRIAPTLKIWSTCTKTIATMTRLVHNPRDPEDVLKVNADPLTGEGGDDAGDMIRYGIMARVNVTSGAPAVGGTRSGYNVR